MDKRRYFELKQDAKKAMEGKMGEAILASLILPIGFSIVVGTFGTILQGINPFLSTILNPFFAAISTYLVLRMIIKISRYKHDKMFDTFFGSKKGILSSLGVAIFFAIPTIAIYAIHWDLIGQFTTIFSDPEFFTDPGIINDIIFDYSPTALTIFSSLLIGLISFYVGIRLRFATYIVADTDVDFLTAIKQSWNYTRGNFFRIFFFPFSFILWFFLVVITCGLALIYVIPYMAIAQSALYNSLLKESNVEFDDGLAKPISGEEIIEDQEAKRDKDPLEEKDVFDDYYK